MNTNQQVSLFYKFFSLFSVVRGYNIFVLVLAQYLASIFIFSPTKQVRNVVLDVHLLYLVLASVCVVSAGYIINNFYDEKADLINKPLKANLDASVSEQTKLTLYFTLNFIGVIFASLVSWKALLFFSTYIFFIWLYSHKLKKYAFIGLLSATILTITPFFVVFIHYKNFSKIIFVHAMFLFLVIMIRELIKDLESIKGAIVNNYNTIPVKYGELRTKQLAVFLLFLTLIPVVIMLNYPAISYMRYYFYFAMITLIFVGIYLWKSNQNYQYKTLHITLKVLLLIGVLSLVFIDTSLLIEKIF